MRAEAAVGVSGGVSYRPRLLVVRVGEVLQPYGTLSTSLQYPTAHRGPPHAVGGGRHVPSRGSRPAIGQGAVNQSDMALMRFEKHCFGLGVPVVPVAMRVLNPWPLA